MEGTTSRTPIHLGHQAGRDLADMALVDMDLGPEDMDLGLADTDLDLGDMDLGLEGKGYHRGQALAAGRVRQAKGLGLCRSECCWTFGL